MIVYITGHCIVERWIVSRPCDALLVISFLFVKSAKYLPGNSPQGTPVSLGSFCFFLVAQPVGFPARQGLTWVPACLRLCHD